jgi:putative transposase
MPARNAIKIYVEDGYYHIYNRGVEKRVIFKDEQDYKVFLNYLKEYLSKPSEKSEMLKICFTLQGQTFKGIERVPKNYFEKIELVAYCLMPNHFHLLIRQNDTDSIKEFMRSLTTRYSMYFNKKYNRNGSLFQGRYRGILITDEPYLLHLSRYIHLNPVEFTDDLTSAYSSYADYLGLRHTRWIKPDIILDQFNNKVGIEFKKINNYKDFVEKYQQEDNLVLGNLAID